MIDTFTYEDVSIHHSQYDSIDTKWTKHSDHEQIMSEKGAEIQQLQARIASLEDAANKEIDYLSHWDSYDSDFFKTLNNLKGAVNESLQQSVAHIQADGLKEFEEWYYKEGITTKVSFHEVIADYIEQLRKEGE